MKMFFLALFSLCALPSLSWPEAISTAPLTLEEVLGMAQKNNPEIKAAEKMWKREESRISAEKTLEKPRVSFESMYSGDEKNIVLSQEFPFPGKLYLRGQVASKEALIAGQSYKAKEREIRSKVKLAYTMYFLALKSIDILEENVELMRRFSKVAESKYSVGKVSQADVLRAQIELSKMLNMSVTLNQEKETAQAMLNMLLNLPPQTFLGIPREPEIKRLKLSLEDLQAMALSNRPEILESKLAVDKNTKALASSRFEYLPDIMAETRHRTAVNPEMDNSHDIMVGFTLPLWFWKQKSMVRMAESEKEVSEAEYQAMKNMTLFNVKDLMVKAQTAERLIDLYNTSVIPQAEQALKVSETAYQSDRVSFLDLIDIQRNLLQFRLEHYQHLADYIQWSAELERVIGKDLSEEKP